MWTPEASRCNRSARNSLAANGCRVPISRAVAFDMLVEPDAGAGLGQNRCERGLADLKRLVPQVVAVQLDQVEGVEEYTLVSALVTDEIERGNAVVIAGDSLPVEMQERERRRASVSTISGKRRVRSLPGRL
jgi:hypothetical protein